MTDGHATVLRVFRRSGLGEEDSVYGAIVLEILGALDPQRFPKDRGIAQLVEDGLYFTNGKTKVGSFLSWAFEGPSEAGPTKADVSVFSGASTTATLGSATNTAATLDCA